LGIDWGTHGEHHWELCENMVRTPKSKRNTPPPLSLSLSPILFHLINVEKVRIFFKRSWCLGFYGTIF
jgi:hypothetical protein